MFYASLFPEERFDPNILMLCDGMGIVRAVGPLGLVYLSSLGYFEIKTRKIKLGDGHETSGKTLYKDGKWGYHAVALHLSLPSAKVAEAVFHPDYYKETMTIQAMIKRMDSLLSRFLRGKTHTRMANFFEWFDRAFEHVEENNLRYLYKSKDMIISSKPKEFGFFPYAFRTAQDITLKDYYERQVKRT